MFSYPTSPPPFLMFLFFIRVCCRKREFTINYVFKFKLLGAFLFSLLSVCFCSCFPFPRYSPAARLKAFFPPSVSLFETPAHPFASHTIVPSTVKNDKNCLGTPFRRHTFCCCCGAAAAAAFALCAFKKGVSLNIVLL